MTHKEATQKFGRCRNKTKGYLLSKNTRLQQRGRAFAIRYHDTDVVMIRPDGTYRLNSGGWNTAMTKKRINQFSPCNLSQTNGMWCMGNIPYSDGMLIDSDGNPINVPGYTMDDVLRLKRRVDRLSNKFVKLVIKAAKYRDIGEWSSYNRGKVPVRITKPHLTKLWITILTETSLNGGWTILNDKWTSSPNHLLEWIHLAVVNSKWGNRQYVLNRIRIDSINGIDNSFLVDSLRTLMRRRKPLIVNMILSGELSDGKVRVS